MTVIVLSSDNGAPELTGGSNTPLKGGKASLWEGGIKSVGFVHGQKVGHYGKSTKQLIHISDWYPTLLYLAKCPRCDRGLDGYNVWKSIR